MALILGLESSCDDTAAALVTSDRQILAQAVVGQNEAHRPFGGVVPEIAARAHVEILPDLVRQVLLEAGKSVGDVDAIAATAGPGLIGGVMVALLAGKGLALGTGKPLIAVNHLEGHALSPRLADPDLGRPDLHRRDDLGRQLRPGGALQHHRYDFRAAVRRVDQHDIVMV